MDALVSAALEEVCARLAHGLPVPELWPALRGALGAAGLPLDPAVKRVLWARLLALPVISLAAGDGDGSPLLPGDPAETDLEVAERRGVRLVASEALRGNFLGMYDQRFGKTKLSPVQKGTLELVGASRCAPMCIEQICHMLTLPLPYCFLYYYINNSCQVTVIILSIGLGDSKC
jgi:general transcription factor 3C polypeptide 1